MAIVNGFRLPYDPRTDLGLIGRLSWAELFDGSTAARAVPMPKDPTLLGENRLRAESIWPEYGQIIDAYRFGRIRESRCWSQLSSLGKLNA